MGIITPSTFDPLHAYVNVRLQQGVPLVDADLNETDDIRKFELRAFLKWFVGDGVPEGNEGFRILSGPANDLVIAAGVDPAPPGTCVVDKGLRHAGRCLVDGLDVLIPQDLAFTAQALHVSQAGAAALADRLGVSVVAALVTPTAPTEDVLVYLDVWERLVRPDEAPDLVLSGLGVETCARVRREWVVRARVGTALPPPTDGDFRAGHAYLPLAQLRRRAGVAVVAQEDIRDLRQRRLLLPPAYLLADTLGVEADDYRLGLGRPAVSLREAVNALLAGQLPSTPDLAIGPAPGTDNIRKAFVLDAFGVLCAFWQSPRSGVNQIVGARFDPAHPPATPPAAAAVTAGTAHLNPTAVALPDGDVVVAYQIGLLGAANTKVAMRRARPAALAAAAEVEVAATSGSADQLPHAVVAGDTVVFFSYHIANNTWQYRRYRHTTGRFVDNAPQPLSAVTTTVQELHAAALPNGSVVVAFADGTNLQLLRLAPDTGTIDLTTAVPAPGTLDAFVLANGAADALVFWDTGATLSTVATTGSPPASWGTAVAVPGTDGDDGQPAAFRDPDGTVFLFANRPTPEAASEVFLRRRNPATREWGAPVRVVSALGNDIRPYPVQVPNLGIWVFWASDRQGNFDLFTKRLITAI